MTLKAWIGLPDGSHWISDELVRYTPEGVDWCFAENKDLSPRPSSICAAEAAPAGPAGRP